MARVVLDHISKHFGSVAAVKDFHLTVEDREFVILVGPSGCGKSTALRMLAGLEDPDAGTIRIGERDVTDLPPKDRDIAMVFQEYALYPHMSVYKNMAFGLKLRSFPKDEIDRRVREAAEILGIQELLDRKPKQLSRDGRRGLDGGTFQVPLPEGCFAGDLLPDGAEVILGIRPNDIHERSAAPERLAQEPFRALIEVVEPLGSEIHITVAAGGQGLIARVPAETPVCVHQEIELVLDAERIHLFAKEPPHERLAASAS